jgi:hypothetical protein
MKEDNNLERFFNTHLERGEIPFDEADWLAMEDKLDKFDAVSSTSEKGNLRNLLLGLGAILLFIAGWWSNEFFNNIAYDSQREDITSTIIGDTIYNGLVDKTVKNPGNSKKRTSDAIGLENSGDNRHSIQDQFTATSRVDGGAPYLKNASVESGNRIERRGAQSDNSEVNPNPYDARLEVSTGNKKIIPLIEKKGIPISVADKLSEIVSKNKTLLLTEIGLEGNGNKVNDEFEGRYSRFSLGLSLAPDLNGVGPAENYRLAWEIGLMGYYTLNRNWRISTGVLVAKKKYVAAGEDYNPPEGYWDYATNGYIPDKVDATCAIIDIPVNFTYLWNPSSKLTITTTTGLSNYIILNEDYSYSYAPGSGYYGNEGWSTTDNSSVLLAMVNVGIGAEWSLRPGLILSIEPYVKVPFKNIGYGNVSLTGTGLFFTIRKNL